jgi:RNA methyltransferase, TrmH family
MEQISSFQNNKVKQIKKLRDKRGREQFGRYVIDDDRDLQRALAHGHQVDYAFYCPDFGGSALRDQIETVYEVPADIMRKVSYRQNPSSLVAVMVTPPALNAETLAPEKDDLLLVLVNLKKPGNIGALLRTADACGVRAVLLVDTALDLYNPNIIRASTGAVFLNNIYTLSADEVQRFLSWNKYQTFAALVDGDMPVYQADFDGRCAIIMGTEDIGLDETWRNAATHHIVIPMSGQVTDSLNVSVSGAIFLYEALRQRYIGAGKG